MTELISALQTPHALITLSVLGLAVILFITGALAPELTGLLSLGLLLACGVLSPQEALAGFGSPALITLLGLFPVSAALFKSGALDRLRGLIASERIRSPRRLIALMAFVIAPVSGVVPNTPVVASLLPVVENWCHRHGISPSRVLLPLSFSTVLGGTLTLLGSSVNLLVSDISQQLGYGSFELFTFTLISLPIWLVGALYLVLAPRSLLPDRGNDLDDLSPQRSGYCTEVTIPDTSELVGRSLLNSRLQRRFDVDVLEIQRGGERLLPPLADRRLEAGDHLLLRVTRDDLLRLQQDHTVQLTTQGQNAGSNLSTSQVSGQKTVEVLLPAGSTLAGASLRELRFRQRHNATVLALRRGQETVQERLGQVVLREGDVLLLQAPFDSIRGLQASNDLLVLDRLEDDLPTVGRKPVAVSIAIAMLLLPTITPHPTGRSCFARNGVGGGDGMSAAWGTPTFDPPRCDFAARIPHQLQCGAANHRSCRCPSRWSPAVAQRLAHLLRPRGDLPWHHPSHPSHEQCRFGGTLSSSGCATSSSPRTLPFRPLDHRVVWGKSIVPHPPWDIKPT
jgi:di/tricarboxylate transporter